MIRAVGMWAAGCSIKGSAISKLACGGVGIIVAPRLNGGLCACASHAFSNTGFWGMIKTWLFQAGKLQTGGIELVDHWQQDPAAMLWIDLSENENRKRPPYSNPTLVCTL